MVLKDQVCHVWKTAQILTLLNTGRKDFCCYDHQNLHRSLARYIMTVLAGYLSLRSMPAAVASPTAFFIILNSVRKISEWTSICWKAVYQSMKPSNLIIWFRPFSRLILNCSNNRNKLNYTHNKKHHNYSNNHRPKTSKVNTLPHMTSYEHDRVLNIVRIMYRKSKSCY